ncbi:transcription initiation factor TFIID subunit 5-like [Octopus vulgaris]|uniref:Transcription initiation factor TFIID subunit 5 n=1 Tax=Octopus vulgaris TaxID=6645 RepID=A0AA36B6F2_OCTVU|nr:transcription initiation factor TFIID subunit 5-like [Octopus vulgaris]
MASTAVNDSVDTQKPENFDKQTLLAVLQFLRKSNLKSTESLLRQEANIKDEDVKIESAEPSESEVSHALAAYKSEDDPTLYDDYYTDLMNFIESCLDVHKVEVSVILYPIFVHMYLELVYNEHEAHAKEFFDKFFKYQEKYYSEDLMKLSTVSKKEHMKGNTLMENFKSSSFSIKMSRDSYNQLKRHLQDKQLNLLLTIIQEHLFIDVYDGVPRTKQQIDAVAGGFLGEAKREANKSRMYYGLLKEPELNIPVEDEDETGDDDKPKKKKPKKDPLQLKKSKNDPNAPSNARIPLPELKDLDKLEKVTAFRETMKRIKLGPDTMPSICFYTFMNSYQGVTAVDFSDDSSLLCAGFGDGVIRVWALTPAKLRSVKTSTELNIIDKEADDVLERMMDDRSSTDAKTLLGHSNSIHSVSFSPDRNFLVSSAGDGTIRLWSLMTWTNLVCYKGHNYPVWDVKFSPHKMYFASAGHDRTARLWSTDHPQPLRIFADHLCDVDCVQFHPNSNYIATGSSDRAVRVWDVLTGDCIRFMTGHKASIHVLQFSPDGRYLASAGVDKVIHLWDMANGNLVAQLKGHTSTVYSLCFSKEGAILASGGLDNSVKLWDVTKVFEEQDSDGDTNIPSTIHVNDNPNLLLGTFPTKSTPVLGLHFTQRNLLLATGPFIP